MALLNEASRIYLGGALASKVYAGSTQVWPTFLDFDLTDPTTAVYFSCSRAADGCFAENADGSWTRFAAATPRITTKGLLTELARSNIVRWNRDLTNAQWGKTNMTVAKDQTGVDNVANSASRMTATAANATITNLCSAAAGNKQLSAFVKRLVGTGTVEMKLATTLWEAITVTSQWTRVNVAVVNAGNPSMGFRLGTSGDSIAVDLVQMEAAGSTIFLSSPIETQGATVARPADIVWADIAALGLVVGPTGTVFAQIVPSLPITAAAQDFLELDDGTVTNRLLLRRRAADSIPQGYNIVNSVNVGLAGSVLGTALAQDTRAKVAISVATGAQAGTKDGGTGVSFTAATPQVPLSTLWLGGASAAGTNPYWGWFERVKVYPTQKTLAELQAMTTLP